MKDERNEVKYPGTRDAMDGNTAVIMCQRESSDAAGAYPITPSTQMGEYWAEETAAGHINVSGRPLIFIQPEGEHAAAAVTAGFAMAGLRAVNFSSGQGIVYMHESLYGAVGKRIPYVLNVGARALTKAALNVHAGHDDYHAVDDTGFFQMFAKDVQEIADLNIIAHRIAELSLNPGLVAQDGFLTTHLIESFKLPERELILEYLGRPEDLIDAPTPAQRMMFGKKRRRIPELWNVDNPVLAGSVQNQDAYMQGVASQRPYFFDHIREFTDQAMDEFARLTGRRYTRVSMFKPAGADDVDYLIVGQGSVLPSAEVVADYLFETRGLRIGVVNMTMFRPFPSDLVGKLLKGRKGVCVLERLDQPLAADLPLIREIRTTLEKCIENGRAESTGPPFPDCAVYTSLKDLPPLYSGSFGMGSRDLQPEGVIGAVENMLDDGKKRRFFYLSIDFVREKPFTAKQETLQREILDAYPGVKDLVVHGSENPNLMPKGSITVRFHSIGGWGAITTGKNLAMTLFDLLGYHIKANPKYGSEKKGQPTTYYLSAAPEPIRMNSEYFYVDMVLSPDPNVFSHSNAVAGLKKGGGFIIQSELGSPEEVWTQQIPPAYQKLIVENDYRIFYLDGFKIAKEVATDPELQFRMQGIAFMGGFFKASPVMAQAKLAEQKLFDAIESQLEHKFGAKGKRVVQDNMKVVRRGFDELREITVKTVSAGPAEGRKEAAAPAMLQWQRASAEPNTDIYRFWDQTASCYYSGKAGEHLADPFSAMSCIPAATGVFRDMTQIRYQHPEWNAERCTGCGSCWTICPDMAAPGLVNTIEEVMTTAMGRVEARGRMVKLLPRATRIIAQELRALISAGTEKNSVHEMMAKAIEAAQADKSFSEEERAALHQELAWLREEIQDFKFGLTKPYYTLKERKKKGSGGLLSITIDPYTCKGCMECVQVCPDDALRPVPQTAESIGRLRKNWEFWLSLPSTSPDYIRIDDLEECVGALETLLLDKACYKSMVGGDGACLGCGEKTVVHLFTATVEALLQPRVNRHLEKLDDLIARLEKRIHLKLAESMDIGDVPAVEEAIERLKDSDLTLANLTAALGSVKTAKPVDPVWFKRLTHLVAQLKHLKWQYTQGCSGRGRSSLGMINATGCTSVWGSTYPFNPYPFPWVNHLFQDCTSMAMGIFEGQMVKMAEGFKAIRIAELELEGKYDPAQHDEFFQYFDWRKFSDEEWKLCPPVVAMGGDGALFDIGFQNLSRMLMSGKPIKVVCLDTEVYSNTGGQACTSGFFGQISDMAQYGKAQKGKEEIRKEFGLIGMAHRTSFVLQGSIANTGHLIEGFVKGLMSRRPALFVVHAPCMPEHGIGDDVAKKQSRMALESRAYPIFMFDPDGGVTWDKCLNLEGNPAVEDKWPSYKLPYTDDEGKPASMEFALTFADFASTEGRFRKHFKRAAPEDWSDSMAPVAEYLEADLEDRKDLIPFVWATDKKGRLMRVVVAAPIITACEDRQNFWSLLKALAGVGVHGVDDVEKREEPVAQASPINPEEIAQRTRIDVVQELAAGLPQLAGVGAGNPVASKPVHPPAMVASPGGDCASGAGEAGTKGDGMSDYVPPTIDSADCTGCGECVLINPKIFGLNDEKLAIILDPKGGSFKDLVKAAEKCAAQVVHPGTPADPSEPGVEKLLKRAEKFNK